MADLKTIIAITHDELKKQLPVEHAVAEAVDRLSQREADVLRQRCGLRDGDCQTLAEIGTELGITRERVRQIECQGLKKFRQLLVTKPLADILAVTQNYIRQHGGAVAESVLYSEFLPESQQTPLGRRSLAFVLDQSGSVVSSREVRKMRAFYATSAAHERAVRQAEPLLRQILTTIGKPASVGELTEQLRADTGSEGIGYLIDDALTEAVLEISCNFVPTTDGSYGLASWPDINPRNIREKTLYALKLAGTPLHFSDITAKITEAKLDTKRVTTQAVHNELINGTEFVLIGRGIYALADWGYAPGTVADVIRTVLAAVDAPLDRESIVSQVLKQRHVSRNTILINLQEKSAFTRVDGNSYILNTASGS